MNNEEVIRRELDDFMECLKVHWHGTRYVRKVKERDMTKVGIFSEDTINKIVEDMKHETSEKIYI